MEVRTPEMKKFMEEMNAPLLTEINKLKVSQVNMTKQLDDATYVDLANGDNKRKKISKVIPIMHNDIKTIKSDIIEIKDTTTILSDFIYLHRLLKKYKLYWIFGIGAPISWVINLILQIRG